jgi:hypothetical protein
MILHTRFGATSPNNALVRMQTTLRFVCTAQLGRYVYSNLNKFGVIFTAINYSQFTVK